MTKFVLLASLLILSFNTFADCSCGTPSFTEQNETDAVEKFVTSKLGSAMVRAITVTENLPYVTYIPSMLPGTIDIRTGPTKCQAKCANIENTVRMLDVEFVKNDKVCVVNLKVTMASKDEGFKSVVKQKYASVCN